MVHETLNGLRERGIPAALRVAQWRAKLQQCETPAEAEIIYDTATAAATAYRKEWGRMLRLMRLRPEFSEQQYAAARALEVAWSEVATGTLSLITPSATSAEREYALSQMQQPVPSAWRMAGCRSKGRLKDLLDAEREARLLVEQAAIDAAYSVVSRERNRK